ncbi:MAG: hypothetical protein RL518_753 [Pseudomonadota bacterium]
MNFLKGFILTMLTSLGAAAALSYAHHDRAWRDFIPFVYWTVPFALLLGTVFAPFFRKPREAPALVRLLSAAVMGGLLSGGWTFFVGFLLGPWALLFSFPPGLCWIGAGCGVAFVAYIVRSRAMIPMMGSALGVSAIVIGMVYGVRGALQEGPQSQCAAIWRDVPNDSLVIINSHGRDLSWFESEARSIFNHGELVVDHGCPPLGTVEPTDGISRTLVVMTKPIMEWSDLRSPSKGGRLIYVQDGDGWKRYPENAPLSRRHFSIGPWSRFIESLADGGWRMELNVAHIEECMSNGPGVSCRPFYEWSDAPKPRRYVTHRQHRRFHSSEVRWEN